jgi:hypothetical protein
MEVTSAVTTNQNCAGDRLKAEAKEYFAKWAMGQCPSSTHGTRHHQRWIGFWAGVEWMMQRNRRVPEQQPNAEKMREALEKLDELATKSIKYPTSGKALWSWDVRDIARAALSD